jgi:hypothetical protein
MNEHPASNLHDFSQHWMPVTANRQFKAAPPEQKALRTIGLRLRYVPWGRR